MQITKPKYEHDCDNCIFLGQHQEYDLYFCENKMYPMLTTYIARFGSNGAEYASSHFLTTIEPLVVARKIAVQKGLVKEDGV